MKKKTLNKKNIGIALVAFSSVGIVASVPVVVASQKLTNGQNTLNLGNAIERDSNNVSGLSVPYGAPKQTRGSEAQTKSATNTSNDVWDTTGEDPFKKQVIAEQNRINALVSKDVVLVNKTSLDSVTDGAITKANLSKLSELSGLGATAFNFDSFAYTYSHGGLTTDGTISVKITVADKTNPDVYGTPKAISINISGIEQTIVNNEQAVINKSVSSGITVSSSIVAATDQPFNDVKTLVDKFGITIEAINTNKFNYVYSNAALDESGSLIVFIKVSSKVKPTVVGKPEAIKVDVTIKKSDAKPSDNDNPIEDNKPGYIIGGVVGSVGSVVVVGGAIYGGKKLYSYYTSKPNPKPTTTTTTQKPESIELTENPKPSTSGTSNPATTPKPTDNYEEAWDAQNLPGGSGTNNVATTEGGVTNPTTSDYATAEEVNDIYSLAKDPNGGTVTNPLTSDYADVDDIFLAANKPTGQTVIANGTTTIENPIYSPTYATVNKPRPEDAIYSTVNKPKPPTTITTTATIEPVKPTIDLTGEPTVADPASANNLSDVTKFYEWLDANGDTVDLGPGSATWAAGSSLDNDLGKINSFNELINARNEFYGRILSVVKGGDTVEGQANVQRIIANLQNKVNALEESGGLKLNTIDGFSNLSDELQTQITTFFKNLSFEGLEGDQLSTALGSSASELKQILNEFASSPEMYEEFVTGYLAELAEADEYVMDVARVVSDVLPEIFDVIIHIIE